MVLPIRKINYKLLACFFIASILFILCGNFALLGKVSKVYGIFGHTLSASILLAVFLYANICYRSRIIVLVLIYSLILLPTVLISKGALSYSGIDYLEINRTITEGNLASLIMAILLTSLTVCASLINNLRIRKLLYAFNATVWLLLFVNALSSVIYTIHYGSPPSAVSLFGIVQTNFREALEYIISRGSFVIIASSLMVIVSPFIWNLLFKLQCSFGLSSKFSGIQAFFVTSAAIVLLFNINLYKPYSTYISVYHITAEQSRFKNSVEKRAELVKTLNLDNLDINNGLFVVVIGESLTRDHMSLYEYDIDTTPWQKSMLSSNNFFRFDNSYSCHVSTALSLSKALTAASQYDEPKRLIADCPSIVDIAKASSYEVSWISNQSKRGFSDDPQSIIASQANHQEFLNQFIYDAELKSSSYDEIVLDTYRKIISGDAPNKIVFVHLMGQHTAYKHRYPESFNIWENNSYDNTVVYNDHILSQLYDVASKHKDFQAMVYFSDHGEDIKLGHNADTFTYTMARTPFWIAVSDNFVKENTDTIDAIKANIEKPFTNDLLFDVVCGLTKMKSHPFYRSALDVTSKDFALKAEDVMIFNTHKVIDDPMF